MVNMSDSTDKGSSPRMRGTRRLQVLNAMKAGIIPAYAGNTRRGIKKRLQIGDHPRVCGEHESGLGVEHLGRGSSPRMRGTPGRFHNLRDETGIIPAYAGNTSHREKREVQTGDHPRVCGEHVLGKRSWAISEGSSPRMRGTRDNQRHRNVVEGIIPAYAGNTLMRRT